MIIRLRASHWIFVSFSLNAIIPTKVTSRIVATEKVGYVTTAGIVASAEIRNFEEKKFGIPITQPNRISFIAGFSFLITIRAMQMINAVAKV